MPAALPHAHLFATLKSLGTGGDPLEDLVRLVAALRPDRASNALLARARFAALTAAIESDAFARESLRACLLALLEGRKQVSFFADSGILPNSGFFSELWRRIVQRFFPALSDASYLRDAVNLIFHRRDDHLWLEALEPDDKLRLWRALDFDAAREHPAVLHTLNQMLDATDVLATRIGAMGLEPELVRLHPRIEERGSPFLALALETHDLSKSYRAYLSGGALPTEDERQLDVLIGQCREVLARVRSRAATIGTSLALTYLLRRLDQSLTRLEAIAHLLALRHREADKPPAERSDHAPLAIDLLGQVVQGEGLRQQVRGHISSTVGLLALRVTDNASRAGEHYITTSREEYFAMWRGAMGAGFIVGFMALLKVASAKATLAPLGYTLAYALNYAAGFMLIHVLHWTLATKQPAMTASTIAGVIGEIRGRMRDVERLATLVTDLVRSQLAAILGNVLIAIPTAMALATLVALATGAPLLDSAKARALLVDISPLDSLALPHAAVAGVCLFLGGLISGYFDNLAAYERIRDRIAHTRWLERLLGAPRLSRLAAYLDDNLGALAGNFFLGVMLAGAGTVGFLTGLPIDVRHVTLSSAQFGLSIVALGFDVELLLWAKCLAGIALIGLMNLTVSFALALWVAMRSRGVGFTQTGALAMALVRQLRGNWRRFLWPGRPDGG
ncbi:MAG: site-specific recombinase [Betaproteobacteria bacterium]|nr:site-specific recombinase [Betaproteobacteria bacterium]